MKIRWFTILVVLLLASGCRGAVARTVHLEGRTMGTGWNVSVVDSAAAIDRSALRARIERALATIDRQMSAWNKDSELSRFNRSRSTQWSSVSPELADVVAKALRIAKISHGAFDPTVAPLVSLWGFGTAAPRVSPPTQAQINNARKSVGHALVSVRLAPPALRKSRGDVEIDVSAIAKGHGVDTITELLNRLGHTAHLVEIGGELRARGVRADQTPWRVAIASPGPMRRNAARVIALRDGAIATSGDYRHYFEDRGRHYSHIIDPRSGYPALHATASVTVVTANAANADGWATALLVLGMEAGLALANSQGLNALFLVRSGNGFVEYTTTDFAGLFWP